MLKKKINFQKKWKTTESSIALYELFYYVINFPEMKITCMRLTLILAVSIVTIYTFPKNVEKSDRHQTHKKQNIYIGRYTSLGIPDFTTEYNITKFYDIGDRCLRKYKNFRLYTVYHLSEMFYALCLRRKLPQKNYFNFVEMNIPLTLSTVRLF